MCIRDRSTPVVFILVIAICAIVGLCNGLVVSYLKVQPFIATLGMQLSLIHI